MWICSMWPRADNVIDVKNMTECYQYDWGIHNTTFNHQCDWDKNVSVTKVNVKYVWHNNFGVNFNPT